MHRVVNAAVLSHVRKRLGRAGPARVAWMESGGDGTSRHVCMERLA